MKKHRVWLDCDPGHDDALAIALACYHPNIDLVGISTVACNQTVEKTTVNALATVHAIGSSVRVFQGQAKPLMRQAPLCPEIHGATGLDAPDGGPLFPSGAQRVEGEKAVIALAQALREEHSVRGGKLDLVCTGALTNLALLASLFPELVTRDRLTVTIMGGAIGVGNTGPVQEFNIQTDPEAASIVFNAGLDLHMVPLEVTHTMLATPAVVHSVSRLGSAFAAKIEDLLHFFAATYREVFRFEHPPVHDPVAVAYVIDRGLFDTRRMRVDIEVTSPLCAGQTICDTWRQSSLPANVEVAVSVDVPACWQLIIDALHAADARSPLNAASP